MPTNKPETHDSDWPAFRHLILFLIGQAHELSGGGRILATGGADGTVKVWDLDNQYYTHNFR